MKNLVMEYLFYIQGVHAVRVELDQNGKWGDVEYYDIGKERFVSDWRMVHLIKGSKDCKKVNALRFWEHIATINYERVRIGIDPVSKHKDFRYFIQDGFAVRAKYDHLTKRFSCERYNPYGNGFEKNDRLLKNLYNTDFCTEISLRNFWAFIAKTKYNMFSVN